MNFSAPFIRRPVGTTLLAIGLLLTGLVAYSFLPVASVPTADFPTIRVSASRPGADPVTMALRPEHGRVSAYFNLDNGTGRIRGVYLQGNDMARPIFESVS